MITIAWCCSKCVHIHTGHTASTQTHSSFITCIVFCLPTSIYRAMIPPNSFFKSPNVMDYSVCLTVKSACSKVVQYRHNDAKTQCFFINHWVILIHKFLTLRWSVILRLECVCSLGSQFRRGAGVLDMVFETPSQLLTCGYDTFVRMWDLRLNPRYVTISFFSG